MPLAEQGIPKCFHEYVYVHMKSICMLVSELDPLHVRVWFRDYICMHGDKTFYWLKCILHSGFIVWFSLLVVGADH